MTTRLRATRWLCGAVLAAVFLSAAAAAPAQASTITILVGDKDWFGNPALTGIEVPWQGNPGMLYDGRSYAERTAADGAQLTDLYSALYFYGADSGCDPGTDPGCTPNGALGTVVFPFSGSLRSATLTMLMGDFECSLWLAMTVDVNGVNLPFCFDDGYRIARTRSLILTPEMLTAANLTGEVRLHFDHSGAYGDGETPPTGSFDYIAFDYFELTGDVTPIVPEPTTVLLVGCGAAGLLGSRRRPGRR